MTDPWPGRRWVSGPHRHLVPASGRRQGSRYPTPLDSASERGGSSSAGPGCGGFLTPRDARNQRRFNAWLLAAMLAYVGAPAALR
jgi:hypothetical protein